MQFLGTVTVITSDNGILATMEGVTVNTGGYTVEEVKANGKTVGWSEKPETPSISCKIAIGPDFDADAVNKLRDGTVVAKGDNGISFQLDGAWTASPIKISDMAGGGELEFKGTECRQLKSPV